MSRPFAEAAGLTAALMRDHGSGDDAGVEAARHERGPTTAGISAAGNRKRVQLLTRGGRETPADVRPAPLAKAKGKAKEERHGSRTPADHFAPYWEIQI